MLLKGTDQANLLVQSPIGPNYNELTKIEKNERITYRHLVLALKDTKIDKNNAYK